MEGKKNQEERRELLGYLYNKDKTKYCKKQKREVFLRKNQSNYWNQVGICHFLKGNYNKAVFYFDMSLRKAGKKSSVETLNNLGVVHLHSKRYRRAHFFFKKAVGVNSKDFIANLNLAHLYMKFQAVWFR